MSRKWVDKKRDKTYKVVFRGHDDPLYHDTEASEHVLVPVEDKRQNNLKVKNKTQLESELGEALEQMRENEGEAAIYGITFDDSKYDYLQHLRPIGNGDGVFIPAKEEKTKNKGIVFKDVELPDDVFQSKNTVKTTYQDQQNVQDDIIGFKPDMNPALREVLEALEDEAYVDDDDAVFDDLLTGGAAIDEEEFEDQFDEWDMDNYEDEMAQYDDEHFTKEGDQGWEAGFRKYEAMNKYKRNDWDSDDEFDEEAEGEEEKEEEEEEEEGDVLGELPSFQNVQSKSKKGSKRKERRKKGTMSDTSSFSMSSSALVRSESLRLLDDRFEQVIKKYEDDAEESDEDFKPFDMKTERADLEDMLDEFLDNYEIEGGRRLVKKSEERNRIKEAADSKSRGKLAQKRKKEKEQMKKSSLGGLTGSLNDMKI